MAPPPPLKLGQRQLFNDSFLSFLRRNNKSQLPPPGVLHTPDSQEPATIHNGYSNGHANRDEGLSEKKALLQEGLQLLDNTKDLLEMGPHILGKENTKRYRKEAAKLTKNAPSKSKLPKKSTAEIAAFQQSAKTLFQEVENLLREFEHQAGQYPGQPQPHPQEMEQHHPESRSRSESPPPLPRKPPSPKVTFTAEMKPDSNVNLTRKSSTRRGPDPHSVELARQESMKPPSSSRHAEDLARSTSQRAPDEDRSKKYELRDDRRDDDRYKYRDDQKRSDSHRYTSDPYQSRSKDYRDRDKDYKPSSHTRHRSDSRDYHKDYYYDSRSRRYDDRDRDRERSRRDDRDRVDRKDSSRSEAPLRVVHEDSPLSAVHGGAAPVAFSPTNITFPGEGSEKRRRDHDRDRERDRYRDRDRDRDRRRDDYYSSRRDDDYYKSSSSRDKYGKSSRRYEDEYRSSGRNKGYDSRPEDRDRDKDKDRNRDKDRDRDRDKDKDRERNRDRDKDRPRDRDRERDRDRDRDRERDKDKDRDRERRHHSEDPHAQEGDLAGSKFQEVFSPPDHAVEGLPLPSEAHS